MVNLLDNGKNTSIKQFLKFQNHVPLVKMLNAWYLQQTEHMKMWLNVYFTRWNKISEIFNIQEISCRSV